MASDTPDPLAGLNPLSRVRARRPDVAQLFEALERKGPEQAKLLTNGVGMKFVLVPAGTYWMGALPSEAVKRPCEVPAHEISLSQPFYLGVSPVTQGQFQQVMGKNPSHFVAVNGGGPDYPVETVSHDDAIAFCKRLTARADERAVSRSYRLPSEAEWEYACRAGSNTPFHTGPALGPEQANFAAAYPSDGVEPGRALNQTSVPGAYLANNFGLHDMHGNVWEWCADWFSDGYYRKSPPRDPQGPPAGRFRVLRGGSWQNHAITCRAGYRNALAPHHSDSATGFRVVCVA